MQGPTLSLLRASIIPGFAPEVNTYKQKMLPKVIGFTKDSSL
jgi:hypothetical protein